MKEDNCHFGDASPISNLHSPILFLKNVGLCDKICTGLIKDKQYSHNHILYFFIFIYILLLFSLITDARSGAAPLSC